MSEAESIHILTDPIDRVACHQCGHKIDVTDVPPFTTVECPACHVQTPVPALLGSFLLFKELGKGAMGAVYQAFDKTLKRHVAIKVMHRSLGEDKAFVEKFLGEARALAALNQANVVQIYACGQEKGQPYIVMELVPGGRVDEVMKQQPTDESFVLAMAIDVARGLRAAHEIGLTHGDIKPDNILLTRDGTAKVVDFGLANFSGNEKQPGEIWGTPYYIAPEVARGQEGSQQSDLYSLGATLFHILAGEPPFDGDTPKDVVVARLGVPAPNLLDRRPDLHQETADLVARMMEESLTRRYPNYDSLLADLEVAARAVKQGPAAPRTTPAASPGGGKGKWLLALLGLALIGGGVWWVTRREKSNPPPPRPPAAPAVPASRSPSPMARKPAPPVAKASAPTKKKPAARKRPAMTFPLTLNEADLVVSTADGDGADSYVQGASPSKSYATVNFGSKKVLWLKSVKKKADLHLARVIYLRFDLSGWKAAPVTDATLLLTAAKGGKNSHSTNYRVRLWGLNEGAPAHEWDAAGAEGKLTWTSAPGLAAGDSTTLDQNATLLATAAIDPNLSVGETWKIANGDSVEPDALVDYLNRSGSTALLVLTADNEVAPRSGWKFVSKEGNPKSAPRLLLKK